MEEFKSNTSNDSAPGNSNKNGKNNNEKNNKNDKQKEIPKGLIGNENAKAYGVYKKLGGQPGQEGPELPKLNIEIERYDYIGTSNVQHKVYSEKGSPMNEYYYANGEVVAQKMFGLKGRISPSKEETINTNGGLMYYEFDGLSSTTALRDRHGDKIEDYRYDVFGNIQTGITLPYNLRGYTGHLYDDKASLVYMNARWYNPNVGRFMTEDTYRGNMSNPQSLNQYAYALNNPVNYVDPTGHLAVYTESKILAMSRSKVNSEISRMSDIWFEDYDIFLETGKHTEKQNTAHQNAELMRELRPYTYYLADTNTEYGDLKEVNKNDNGSRIIYTYERTVTITEIYKNDYKTKERIGTGVEKYDVTVTAAELAKSNQKAIKKSAGSIDLEWNEKIYETEPDKSTAGNSSNNLTEDTQNQLQDLIENELIEQLTEQYGSATEAYAYLSMKSMGIPQGYISQAMGGMRSAMSWQKFFSTPVGQYTIRATPIVGSILDVYELKTNTNLFTGEELSELDRTLTEGGLLISVIVPWADEAAKGIKYLVHGDTILHYSGDTLRIVSGSIDDITKGTGKLVNGFDTTVHAGKQGKHILGHNNYTTGRSILNGTLDDAQKLVDDFAGTGEWITSNKERVDFGRTIGQFVDQATGEAIDTSIGIIHYSNKGVHIIPARPMP
ncbi:hypothetical protein JYG23_04630 [Sedimentibacter sp. zth1]|uniref:polymorphic toxin type 50 domain-containing protein n=1 Tax=Sedimentibacter sp. zth1 TaxID=2816908 RepID=UPI001A92EF1C|nr:polymorphic toxin type 50 domain-containing protein [Sedimentibacter sp. zth1]QSX06736.1 hypothetical protein JYG23_04630 [Sedimentibacter sp. zth1]